MVKKLLRSFLFIGIGVVTLYLVFYFQQKNYAVTCLQRAVPGETCSLWNKLWQDFSQANVFYLLLTAALFMVSNWARALRWKMMLEPMGVNPRMMNALGAIMIAYLTNLTIPRSGEFARATVLSKYEDIDFEKAFGTIITDRIIDVICLLVMGALTFLLAFNTIYRYFEQNLHLHERMAGAGLGLWIGLVVLVLFMAIVIRYRQRLMESNIGKKIQKFLNGLQEGLFSVFRLKNPMLFVFYSVVIWSMYFLMAYTMFKSFYATEHLGLVAGLVVFFFGSLGIVFPSPGGMGSYHWLTMQSLGLYGIANADAFSYANMTFFTIQIFTIVLVGVAFLIALPLINAKTAKG